MTRSKTDDVMLMDDVATRATIFAKRGISHRIHDREDLRFRPRTQQGTNNAGRVQLHSGGLADAGSSSRFPYKQMSHWANAAPPLTALSHQTRARSFGLSFSAALRRSRARAKSPCDRIIHAHRRAPPDRRAARPGSVGRWEVLRDELLRHKVDALTGRRLAITHALQAVVQRVICARGAPPP